MVNLKKHDNDNLIKYLLDVLEMLKNPMMEEKDLGKLSGMFNIEKINKPVEKKVIVAPLLDYPSSQGIKGSSILTTKSYLD